jgi:hypothetical protein
MFRARVVVLRAAQAVLLFAPLAVAAQGNALPMKLPPRPTTGPITVPDLMTRLYRVADDSMGGRPTGSEGHLKVTQYIADEARRLGLQPAGENGGYFQDLPMTNRGFAAGSSVMVATERFSMGTDFAPMVARGGQPRPVTRAEIVVGGTQGDSSTWISADAARGKVVVLRANDRVLQLDQRFLAIGSAHRFVGAAAVVVPAWEQLAPPSRAQLSRPAMVMGRDLSGPMLPPTLIASRAMVDALIAQAGRELGINLRYEVTQAAARNVVAILPGSDPTLRGQYVALGAHTDHDPLLARGADHDSLRAYNQARDRIGREAGSRRPSPTQLASVRVNVDSLRAIRPARSDSIKNGADDDGSGTVTMLEIAEAFATSATKPKRSLLFVWHAAEEIGLLGAALYSEQPTVPMDSIVAQLNMDMVGRGGVGDIADGGPRYLQLVGSRRLSRELGNLVEAVNARQPMPFRFDYSYDADGHPENIYCRSDHAMYARYGVPVTFFHTGLHHDYHQVTDEPQYIDYEKMSRIANLVFDVAKELGNQAQRPRLSVPKPDPTARCRQ